MTTQFAQAPLALIAKSLTNPRKTFNQAKLDELTSSIKAMGVHQPVLLRPLPASRLEDTAYMQPRPEYELVCGERRYRASLAAKMLTIPAMVRELTDDQVMEIQIIENLQRDDLTELEEAEGYESLMQHSSLTAEQVGEKIGKSRSYVYARIKLLDLCQDARISLRDGSVDASRALVVARIPNEKLQIKAMKEIVGGDKSWHGISEPMSYRAALDHVQKNYMLKLSDAKFEITCVDLLPDAGSCQTCTKRTGHDPDLFSDVKGADICTDPPCFHRKEEAHTAVLIEQAKAKGQTVISGKEAAELRGAGYQDKFTGYRRLDDAQDSPTDQPLRKIIGKLMQSEGIKPVAIEHPTKKGVLVECLPNEVALKLLKMVERQSQETAKVSKEVQQLVSDKKAKAEAKATALFEQGWRDTLLRETWMQLRDDASAPTFTTNVHRYLAVRSAKSLSTDNAEALCRVLNLGKVSPIAAVTDFAKETPSPELFNLLVIMQEASSAHDHAYEGRIANEGLLLIAGNAFGDALEATIQEIKLDVKANVWPENPQKVPTANVPAAQADGGVGEGKKNKAPLRAPKPKLRAEEAMLGIAAAMQGAEASGSARRPEEITGADAQSNDGGADSRPTDAADASSTDQQEETARISALVDDINLFNGAVYVITREQKANVRLLKAELKVGTKKAMELMEKLELAGKVSACNEGGVRKVLVSA